MFNIIEIKKKNNEFQFNNKIIKGKNICHEKTSIFKDYLNNKLLNF